MAKAPKQRRTRKWDAWAWEYGADDDVTLGGFAQFAVASPRNRLPLSAHGKWSRVKFYKYVPPKRKRVAKGKK